MGVREHLVMNGKSPQHVHGTFQLIRFGQHAHVGSKQIFGRQIVTVAAQKCRQVGIVAFAQKVMIL